MGMHYNRALHTYQRLTAGQGYWLNKGALDADTLQPFERGVITARFLAMQGRHSSRVHVKDRDYEE